MTRYLIWELLLDIPFTSQPEISVNVRADGGFYARGCGGNTFQFSGDERENGWRQEAKVQRQYQAKKTMKSSDGGPRNQQWGEIISELEFLFSYKLF